MSSDYKWREQKSSRLNGSKIKDSPFENGKDVSTTTDNFVRKHQRNLSLPVNSVYSSLMVINYKLIIILNYYNV